MIARRVISVLWFLLAAVTCIVLFEGLLHLYNPNRSRLRNGKILLPANQTYVFTNTDIPKIEKRIVHSKNSLGFRGPEIPARFGEYLSIIVAGGSTTECFYLSDDKTWPYLVGERLKGAYDKVWVNNAGLDGFSTFGIIPLLHDHITRIRPAYTLFLLGANEIGRKGDNAADKDKMAPSSESVSILKKVKNESELFEFARITWNNLAKRGGRKIGHHPLDLQALSHVNIDQRAIDAQLDVHRKAYIPGYRQRLMSIIRMCRENGIRPVFITQPTLAGKGVDASTGVNLETMVLEDGSSGLMEWKVLELYNDTLREISRENAVPLIDLAAAFPRDSRYYYDKLHFDIEGSRVAAAMIGDRLKEIIAGDDGRLPGEFRRGDGDGNVRHAGSFPAQ